jgi:hypothetical protein
MFNTFMSLGKQGSGDVSGAMVLQQNKSVITPG